MKRYFDSAQSTFHFYLFSGIAIGISIFNELVIHRKFVFTQ